MAENFPNLIKDMNPRDSTNSKQDKLKGEASHLLRVMAEGGTEGSVV